MGQNRQRGAQLQGRADALHGARHVEDDSPRRQAAEQRRQCEHREPDEGDAAAANAIGKRTRRHQQRRKGEDVGADHPFDVRERGAEIARDRR